MLEARVQLPPIVVSREHADRIEQHRARFAALLPGVPISRTWAVADLLRLGLDDLEAELVELGQRPRIDDAQPAHATDTYFVTLPSPPRGSRWAPRGGKPARGFARLPSMWVPATLAESLAAVLSAFESVAPGVVESRAALVREALGRAFARLDAQAEMVRSIADVIASSEPRFTPAVGVITLSVPMPARGRPPRRARTPRRRARRRARSRRTRASRRRAARGDPDPAPARRASHAVGGSP